MSPIQAIPAIRPLVRADAAAFRAIRVEALTRNPGAFGAAASDWAELSDEAVAARIPTQPPSVILGAFAQEPISEASPESLVAMAGLMVGGSIKQLHKGLVWGVYVREAWRRQGLAAAMIDALIAHARRCESLEILLLSVAADNPAARALYVSRGFTPYGLERHALKLGPGNYRDEELMALDLAPHGPGAPQQAAR
ncbi:GNAT family N-acetyltransferase [Chelatococcus asaccharovorans]|uniref:GNAT family N-acetyltransferase n=1 Tax=Chelatococcus asaccharovorans TaxID=28210 RepID=UPI00224C6DE4|nr:N-acetyltransferase [Chelatococcus asaccharovorans]CAH1658586.1 Ribosomal protein S18 acetylase RimI-like enzyme [Chelatococcus asaccharovorans]CAH1684463.1 Ribosomal protein S18 acetylase RimI-like enzyme [Chelatococcus asaccharovorans]